MTIAETLMATAVTVGVIHTLIGVDHAIPFIVLSRAQGWSLRKTWLITAVCGLGHVLSSVVIGAVGIGLGIAVSRLEWVEGQRGALAAWTLIGFGLAYMVWGFYRTWRSRSGAHLHEDGTVHRHPDHGSDHSHHHHGGVVTGGAPTVGALFIVFVLGPCEALIPLLMVPASQSDPWLVVAVVGVFGLATIATMLTVVTLGYFGLRAKVFDVLERHVHTAAGLAIALSGLGIQLLGI